MTTNTPGDEPAHRAVPADGRVVDSTTVGMDRTSVVAREKEQFGGMKFGTAFFGWLTATGTVVLLSALAAGVAALLGVGRVPTTDAAIEAAQQNATTLGVVGAVVLLVVLLIAYFAGGYVAGRMARFSGAKQGVAVWLWSLIFGVILAIIGAIAGSQLTLPGVTGLPSVDGSTTIAASVITAVLALAVSLVGAVLGGLAGMRFHRRVDRAGFGA